jgi:F-type H+-transporting ATPase subunit epsilon
MYAYLFPLFLFCYSYINYSQIAARLVRQALKGDFKVEALKRDEVNVKFTQWKDGKPISTFILRFIKKIY